MGDQVKVCLMDMDDRTRQSMMLVLKHRTNDSVLLADEDTADIAVLDLDLDLERSLKTVSDIRGRKPAMRTIGLSSKTDIECDDVLIIQKPISAGRLLDAIQQVSGQTLQIPNIRTSEAASSLSARVGSTRRRPESAAVSEDKMSFDPNAYLLGTILNAEVEAKQRGMAAIISFYGDRLIGIGCSHKSIETNLTSSQARGFAISAVNGDEGEGWSVTVGLQRPTVEYVPHAEAKKRFAGKTYNVPQEIFMWKLGVTTSRGRLPAGVGMEERVYLRRWPNLTRFSYTDNEMRIIAYWMRQASSVREIADALDIPLQEVCSVYTAAYAAGLAGVAKREVDGVWEAPDVTEHKERGVFSSILKRLLQRKPATVEETAA